MEELLELMKRLRDQLRGCPWDRAQSFATIAPYTLEEAYEVADAIGRESMGDLRDELGDLLFQVVFHAELASELGRFTFADVVRAVVEKMIRRHPHVFATGGADSADAAARSWEEIKATERRQKAQLSGEAPSALDGVPVALPGLTRAVKLQRRAARVGFDWPSVDGVRAKLAEEIGELEAEIDDGPPQRIEDELGDLLFSCANLARHLHVDPEAALRGANRRFERRFRRMEADGGKDIEGAGIERLEALWRAAKAEVG